MKVYQLMSKLESLPAGNEVRINIVRNLDEMECVDESEGNYAIVCNVEDIETDGVYTDLC